MTRSRTKPRGRLGLWLLLIIIVAVWVWRWPARQPIHDTIDYLETLGYECAPKPQTKSIYFCADKDNRDQTNPESKTSLWLYSPYQVVEAEALMDAYCQDSNIARLWEADLKPTIWEIDRQALIMPHRLYGREDLIDQYPARQAWLETNLKQMPVVSLTIDLDTRCRWYVTEPAGESLI